MKFVRLQALPPIVLALALACGPESPESPEPPSMREARVVAHQSSSADMRLSDWSVPINLGAIVNSVFTDTDPSVSKDGLSLYFTSGGNRAGGFGGRDVWVTQRVCTDSSNPACAWGTPVNLGSTINSAAHEGKPTISVDGHRLYFASERSGGYGGFDLYVSRRRDKSDNLGWEPPVNLGPMINTSASEESAVTFFEDDATGSVTMYFASNRPGGGVDDWDIYASMQQPDGTFGPAVRVDELSTTSRDRDPHVRRDGLEIFLESNRPGTYGGLDLWVATRAGTTDPWSTPVNLGPVINSPTRPAGLEQSNDQRPWLSFDGNTLYFSSAFRPGNVDFMFDIWAATRSEVKKHGN